MDAIGRDKCHATSGHEAVSAGPYVSVSCAVSFERRAGDRRDLFAVTVYLRRGA